MPDGINPEDFNWKVSEVKEDEPPYIPLRNPAILQSYRVTAWNTPKNGEGYADPDVRVRCYIRRDAEDSMWCDVHCAWGVTAGMADPDPLLFHHNAAQIAEAFEITGQAFPWHDIRLHTQAKEFVQIGKPVSV